MSNVIHVRFPKAVSRKPKRKGLGISLAAGDGCVFIAASGRQRFTIAQVNDLIQDLRDVRDDAKGRAKAKS